MTSFSRDGLVDFLIRHPWLVLAFLFLAVLVLCVDYVCDWLVPDKVLFFFMDVVERVTRVYEVLVRKEEVVV